MAGSVPKPASPMSDLLGVLLRLTVWLWYLPGGRGLARRVLAVQCWLDMLHSFRRAPNRPDVLFNDYLYALKVGPRLETPLMRRLTDKAEVKTYIEERLGPGRTIPTLAVLGSAQAISDYVPPVFPVAVKPTAASGRLLRIGSVEEWAAARAQITSWLGIDYFALHLERHYAGLVQQVIVEPWLEAAFCLEGTVHCRNGVPKAVTVIDRISRARQIYTPEGRPLGVSFIYPLTDFDLDDWGFFQPLLRDCALLSAGLDYIRVDCYSDGKRLIYGELTCLPGGATGRFHPENGEEVFSAVFFAD
jgi:hypothetical protein